MNVSKTKAKVYILINYVLDKGLNNVIEKKQLSTFKIEKYFFPKKLIKTI